MSIDFGRFVLITALGVLFGLAQPLTSWAQAGDEWLGIWHLNPEKSTYDPGPAPYRRGTWRIERAGDQLAMIYDLVGVRGGVTHMEWSGRFDGAPYRLQGPDAVVTYAYTPAGARTLDLIVAIDGVPSVRGRAVLSADGRTITATTSSRTARGKPVTTTSVYEKR